jgi:hypothetical protein
MFNLISMAKSFQRGWTRRAALLAAACVALGVGGLRAQSLLQSNDRLAFCGDSGTDGMYSQYIEDFLVARQAVSGIDIRQFNWVAATPGAFLPLLGQDVLPWKPTVAAIYFNQAAEGPALETRRADETALIGALKAAGVRAIILGSPSCLDPAHFPNDPAKANAANSSLAATAAVDQAVAAKAGVTYADVYGATMAVMTKAQAKLGPGFVFDGQNSAVVAAYAFLKALAVDPAAGRFTASFTPDFKIGQADAREGAKVLSTAEQSFTAQSPGSTFAFPGTPTSDRLPEPVMACFPFYTDLDRLTLVVKDLPTPLAKVYWNDKSADFSSADLAQGIVLPATLESPFRGQCEELYRAVGDQQTAETAVARGANDPKAAALAAQGLAAAEALVKPVTYTIRVQPLAAPEKRPPGPVNIIVDTDMNGDCDDAGAVALLNDFMCEGECTIIAANVNTHDAAKSSGAVVNAIDTYYGHPNIPIGACYDTNEPQVGSTYTALIHKQFDPTFPDDDHLPKGVDVYRKALAAAPDGSVVICSIGWMENITDLLRSGPDSVSPLSGMDLVKRKVRQLVVMANTNPNDVWVVQNWPTPILWTTDIGNHIYPGRSLTTTPADNPVRIIYRVNGAENGRQGWDPTAAWLAVRGPGEVYDVAVGGYWKVNVPPAQYGTWINGPRTNQGMATVKMPDDQALKLFDAELARPPGPAHQ